MGTGALITAIASALAAFFTAGIFVYKKISASIWKSNLQKLEDLKRKLLNAKTPEEYTTIINDIINSKL
jgi:hypothetical protein